MSHLILVRHGESELNVTNKTQRIFNGAAETPLTDLGRQQAIDAGKQIAELDMRIRLAVSSTLLRSIDTADLALKQLPYHVPLEFSPQFRERSLGIFECRPKEDVFAEYPDYRDTNFTLDFSHRAPGGENLTMTTERAWAELKMYELECPEGLCVFSHSTTIRCLLGRALGLSQKETIAMKEPPNATPIILAKTDSGYEIVSEY